MAMDVDLIWEIERDLADGRGDAYERHLAPEAIVVVPGMTLDKAATVAAMDASPGWDEWSFGGETARELGDDGIVLNCGWSCTSRPPSSNRPTSPSAS
jgi:hypothetical protein